MDFEIEDDSGEFTPYGNTYSAKSSGKSARKSSLFGGGLNDDEDAYNFQYDAEQDYTKRSSSHAAKSSDQFPIPAFSPRPDQIKHHKQIPKQDMSALDKAKEMLQKYNKPTTGLASLSQSTGNRYKTGRASLSFDEEELSEEEEEEESRDTGEYGDLSISSPGTSLKNFKSSVQTGATSIASAAISSSSMKSNKQNVAEVSSKPNISASLATAKPVSVSSYNSKIANTTYTKMQAVKELEESIEEEDYEDDLEEEDESVAKSSKKDEKEDDYENDEFDDEDEEIEASDDNIVKNKNVRSNSNESDNVSYSRMVYGNEEEDVSSESLEESKPKILSFADLADISGWEAPSLPVASVAPISEENAVKSASSNLKADPVAILSTKSVAASAPVSTFNAASAPVSTFNAASATARVQSVPSIPVAPKATIKSVDVVVPIPTEFAVPTASTSRSSTIQPAVPVPQSIPPSIVYPEQQTAHIATSAPVNPAVPQVPTPAAPSVSSAPQSAYSPYGYPYPPYAYPPPTATIPGGYAMPPDYAAGTHPMPPPHMMGYGYPSYPFPSPYGFPFLPYGGYSSAQSMMSMDPMNLRGSVLNRSSLGLGMGNTSGFMPPRAESDSSQRVIMDLLSEYNKVKEEAEWSKRKLAEMIILMEQQQKSTKNDPVVQSNPPVPVSLKNDDVNESAAEYSMDFEVSQLHAARAPIIEDPTAKVGHSFNWNEDMTSNGSLPPRNASSWSPPKLRHSEPTLSNVLQGQSNMDRNTNTANTENRTSTSKYSNNINKENEMPKFALGGGFDSNGMRPDPLAESVAKSFLASQELLRSKFDALRLKIQMSSSVHRNLREYEELQSSRNVSDTSSIRPTTMNSLDSFKQEAQKRREEDARRLFALLREKYPDLKPAEILDLANKFGSM